MAEKIAAGDFSDRIISSNKDEIGKLAETINYLGQQLSKIEQLRKDLIANVSHELRTPLSLIRGYAETIRDVTGNVPDKREKQLGIIIINNAFNYTPGGGTITVKAIDGLKAVRVEVSDTGSGIPEEDLPHIWDRYYKAEKASGKRAVGTGLGLAIVKSVLDAHQAAYGVESKREVGTTFWFELKK